MKKKQSGTKRTLTPGEQQILGFSPTICRRAIAALRAADKALGDKKRDQALPSYCEVLHSMLIDQLGFESGGSTCFLTDKTYFSNKLNQMEIFLDIVEGKEISEEQFKKAVNPLCDIHEAAEDAHGR